MSKGGGSSRTSTWRNGSGSITIDNEFDGNVLHGQGSMSMSTVPNTTYTATDRKMVDLFTDYIKKDMKERGIPEDIVADLSIRITPSKFRSDRAGEYNNETHSFAVNVVVPSRDSIMGAKANRKMALEKMRGTFYHELGHAVHSLYFPRWTAGDTSYSTTDMTAKAYTKSPKEAFANRFRDAVLSQKSFDFKSVVSMVKRSVDNDKSLNPIDRIAYEQKFKDFETKRPIKVYGNRGSLIPTNVIVKKIRGVKNGKLYTIVKGKES